ncbi:MAG: hypothetical protein ACRD1E_11770, partial [Terriglobales bacterium]
MRLAVVFWVAISPLTAQIPVRMPAGTRLEIQIPVRTRVRRVGQAVQAQLRTPVYLDNELALPAGTAVEGTVTAIRGVAWWRRGWDAFGGDFSPAPAVTARFDALQLPDGRWV